MRIPLRPPTQKWVQKKPSPIHLLETTQIVTTVRPRVYEEEVSRKRTSSSSLSPNLGKAAVGTSRPILVSRLCAARRSWCLRLRLLPTGRKNLAGASRPPWSRTCPPYPRPSGGSQFTLARSSGAGRVPPSHRPPWVTWEEPKSRWLTLVGHLLGSVDGWPLATTSLDLRGKAGTGSRLRA